MKFEKNILPKRGTASYKISFNLPFLHKEIHIPNKLCFPKDAMPVVNDATPLFVLKNDAMPFFTSINDHIVSNNALEALSKKNVMPLAFPVKMFPD